MYHLATVLDPRYFYNEDGHPLTDEQLFDANEFFLEFLDKLKMNDEQQALATECFTLYKGRNALFSRTVLPVTDPIKFWLKYYDLKKYRDLASVSIRLLSVRPQSADCERMNSVHKCVQTKSRNRLVTAKVEKILRSKCYLKNENGAPDDYRFIDSIDFDPDRSLEPVDESVVSSVLASLESDTDIETGQEEDTELEIVELS